MIRDLYKVKSRFYMIVFSDLRVVFSSIILVVAKANFISTSSNHTNFLYQTYKLHSKDLVVLIKFEI